MNFTASTKSTAFGGKPRIAQALRPVRGAQRPFQRPIRRMSHPTMAAATLPVALVPSLLGGLSLGVLAVTRLVVSGRILGISGTVKGIITGDYSSYWRYLFLAGLLSGGLALGFIAPSALETIPASMGPASYAVSGLLVGAGTALGNGCTSGHGICGNARLSPRSFVSTLTFMAAGAAAAAALRLGVVFGLPSIGTLIPLNVAPPADLLSLSQGVLAASIALLAAATLASKLFIKRESGEGLECSIEDQPVAVWLERFVTYSVGLLFALGLGASGMLKPSKVTGFLTVVDPSLAFVMGGALLVALPGYQLVTRTRMLRKPLCSEDFLLPAAKAIDWKLVVGAALFGLGWGSSGICPGPGIVAFTSFQSSIFSYLAAMVVGMTMAKEAEKIIDAAAKKAATA